MTGTAGPKAAALEEELVSEFARVMHEWNFRPFRRGEITLPTREEALLRLLTSPYTGPAVVLEEPLK